MADPCASRPPSPHLPKHESAYGFSYIFVFCRCPPNLHRRANTSIALSVHNKWINIGVASSLSTLWQRKKKISQIRNINKLILGFALQPVPADHNNNNNKNQLKKRVNKLKNKNFQKHIQYTRTGQPHMMRSNKRSDHTHTLHTYTQHLWTKQVIKLSHCWCFFFSVGSMLAKCAIGEQSAVEHCTNNT